MNKESKRPTVMLLLSMLICISSVTLTVIISLDIKDVVYPLTMGVIFTVMAFSIFNAIFMAVAQYRYAKGAEAYPESNRKRFTSSMYRQSTHWLLIMFVIVLYIAIASFLKGLESFYDDDIMVLGIMLIVSMVVSSLMHECARWMPDQPAGTTSNES